MTPKGILVFCKIIQLSPTTSLIRGRYKTYDAIVGSGIQHAYLLFDMVLDNPTITANIYAHGPNTPAFTMSNFIVTFPNANQTQVDIDFINTLNNSLGPLPVYYDMYCDFVIIG